MKNIERTPTCVGVIIDGNRRWALENDVTVHEGHRVGYKRLQEFIIWARDAGVKYCVAYVFSTENWNRSAKEVQNLMGLVRHILMHEVHKLKEEGVRLVMVGQRERLAPDIQKLVQHAEEKTQDETRITVGLALSYGGRAEIIHAVQKLLDEKVQQVDEKRFTDALWTAGIPDLDLIIRTGGEERLSNFLPWQSVYSELFFTDTLWPDFTEEEFKAILREFSQRSRRYGR